MTTWYGVDASFDDLSLEEAKRLKAAGVELFVQCLWTGAEQPAPRVANLRNAVDAGLHVAGYTSVTRFGSGRYHADQGRAGVPDDLWAQLLLVPVDVELVGIPDETIRDALERYVELGKRRAVYTSYGHWTSYQRNTTAFRDCLLWNASWDRDPDIDFNRLPYGGWGLEQVVAEQWSGGTHVEGVFVDRNTWVKELLMPEGENDETRVLIGNLLAELGRVNERHVALLQDVRGVAGYAYRHANDEQLHAYMAAGDPAALTELGARVDDLDRRIAAAAEALNG